LAKKNHTQWRTDLIFFDNKTICLTPNYHVQKMFSANQGDYYFDKVVNKDSRDSTLAASVVQDSKTGDVILKLVNTGTGAKVMKINLDPFKKFNPLAEQTLLLGSPEVENTVEQPKNIAPITSSITVSKLFDYNAPPMSLTVIRIKTK
jgi:alpha-L-arabinofuranosidase